MTTRQRKPLPAATRLVLTCKCGRAIPRREHMALVDPRPCPDCGSTRRRWERCPAGPVARLIARIRLKLWNRARPTPRVGSPRRKVSNA